MTLERYPEGLAARLARALLAALLLAVLGTGAASALVWYTEVVDAASSGQNSDIALDIAGNPHISYFHGTSPYLMHAWRDAGGWHTEVVDEVADPMNRVFTYSSIALDAAGNPRIGYNNDTAHQGNLKYAWRDAGGWHTEVADAEEDVGYELDIALDAAGNPGISYVSGTPAVWYGGSKLKYAWRDGAGWHNETVHGGMYEATSLALDADGNPRIGYYDALATDLRYAWRDGTGWYTENVDGSSMYNNMLMPNASSDVGKTESLALDAAGNPRIGYYDATNDNLKYAWRDALGWHVEVVDADGGVGSSLALDTVGNPRITYFDITNQKQKYAWGDGAGWHTETVDSRGIVGWYSSLALDGAGSPGISYQGDGPVLMYAWAEPPPAPAIEVTVEVSGDFGITWQDADAPPGPAIAVGSPVMWTYTVTNTGNVALENVTVTDDRIGPVRMPGSSLEPGQSMNGTATGTAVAGPYANNGTATGTPPGGLPDVTASAPSHYYGVASSAANFTWTPEDPVAGESVRFTDTSGGSPQWWGWNFGDGTAGSIEQNPVHAFAAPGNYTVMLSAYYPGSEIGRDAARMVSVTAPPIGGSTGYFLVSTAPAGAKVFLRDIGGGLSLVGNTSAGPLNVTVYLTGTPVAAIVANLSGYADAVYPIASYPPAGGTVPVNLTLAPAVLAVPPSILMPTDTDGDGLYDDVNGNGRKDFADVVLYFNSMTWIAGNEPVPVFDFNGNSRIDFADVVLLFNRL